MSYFLLCNNSSALEQSTFDNFYNSIICVTDGSFSLGWILDSSSSLLSVGGLTDSTQYSINLTHRPSSWPSTTVPQFFFFKLINLYFYFTLFHFTVLVLPYINMNPPRVLLYMDFPSGWLRLFM